MSLNKLCENFRSALAYAEAREHKLSVDSVYLKVGLPLPLAAELAIAQIAGSTIAGERNFKVVLQTHPKHPNSVLGPDRGSFGSFFVVQQVP